MPFSKFTTWPVLSIPLTKVPIDVATFVSYILPPAFCFFVMAVLVITPRTRTMRLALWPIITLLALRAALSVDMSLGNPERILLNVNLSLSMFYITVHALSWTFPKEPLVRHLRPANNSLSTIMDALDLISNLRGHGWEWSRGLRVPHDSRPTNRTAFVFHTLLSTIMHALMCGTFHRAVLSISSVGVGSMPGGSTIFDDTLPFSLRYLRASFITLLSVSTLYTVLHASYDLCTIPAVLFLGQDPAQWPPPFDSPWLATSLSDFWGRRWHQWFRHMFLVVGGYPLSFVFGRVGLAFGAFFASALFHHVAMIELNNKSEFWRMLVGFGMMAPGIIAERVFQLLTGRKVDGVAGWIWTMAWLFIWGNVMIEGFVRAGTFGCPSFIDSVPPVRVLVERWVVDLDIWLHTI